MSERVNKKIIQIIRVVGKSLLFYLVAPLVTLLLIELLLRFGGYGDEDELFTRSKTHPSSYSIKADYIKKYFPFSEVEPDLSNDTFLIEKPANGIRVFVLGENAAAGFPWLPNGRIALIMSQILQETFSENRIEVIDLSIPGINSHGMLNLMSRVVKYEPDAVVIYPGHNEFYGALGPVSVDNVGTNREQIKLYLRLQRYKLFQLLKPLFIGSSGDTTGSRNKTESLIETIAKKVEVKPEGELYEKVLENYKSNLREMLEIANAAGIIFVGGIPVSNFSGKAPFKTCYENITDIVKWRDEVEKGKAFLFEERYEDALLYFSEAGERYGVNSELQYYSGLALQGVGKRPKAREQFRKAVDNDCMPFRAATEFNREMAAMFRSHGQPFVSVGLHFDTTSVGKARGDEHFVDAVHFTLKGAVILAERITSELIVRFGGIRRPKPSSEDIDKMIVRAGMTQIDYAIAELRITDLRARWPYKERERTVPSFSTFRSEHVEELALDVKEGILSWEEAHKIYADSLYDLDEFGNAEGDYRALVVANVSDVVPYLRLAELLLHKGYLDEAYELLERSTRISTSLFALKWMGSILLGNGLPVDAISYLAKANKMEPSDKEVLYNITVARIDTDNIEEAKESFKELYQLDREYPGIFSLAERIRSLSDE
ncbi:tetratricopeptide repeat protein [Candidatus Marinimicrobia bacterium MT.SAG.3]|nr:tetratricopeptide repeat protein [Candidatus Marinimicrobia bacterium MT.SAG.3]